MKVVFVKDRKRRRLNSDIESDESPSDYHDGYSDYASNRSMEGLERKNSQSPPPKGTNRDGRRKKHGSSHHISKEMIQQVMHLKQKAAASQLRIGVSTLKKRFGSLFHNDRWPSTDAERLKMSSFIDQEAMKKGSLEYILHKYWNDETFLDGETCAYLRNLTLTKRAKKHRSRNDGYSQVEGRYRASSSLNEETASDDGDYSDYDSHASNDLTEEEFHNSRKENENRDMDSRDHSPERSETCNEKCN